VVIAVKIFFRKQIHARVVDVVGIRGVLDDPIDGRVDLLAIKKVSKLGY
jgi:hypothetical protein